MKRFIRIFLIALPLGYMLFIWILSSKPSDAVVRFGSQSDDLIREALHLIEFGILYFLILIALHASGKPGLPAQSLAITISIFYSIMDEIHQSFIPYRTASLLDLLKDFIGIFLAYHLCKHYSKKIKISCLGDLLKKLGLF
ncbi:MAG: VanZ family protein [Peptococcaceae bacterium]|nr:VanZ family protein [Peptococcaceae bacterium]